MLNSKEHIRHCLLYEYQLGHTASEAERNICRAIGPGAVSNATAWRWFDRFRNKDFSLQDEPKSGRPMEIDLSQLRQAIESEPTQTTRDVASTLGCTHGAVRYHFKRLCFVSKLGDWTPHDLSPVQLQKRVEACQQLLSSHRTFNWLDNLITGDEKWVLYANVQRKRQWLPQHKKPAPTPKPGLHPQKRMISVWWDVQGVLYWELLPEKTTINGTSYCVQLAKLAAQVERKRPRHGKIFFQHDNARPHVAEVVQTKLAELNWELLPHPPYSPDIAPSDFHLFRSMDNNLRTRHFKSETVLRKHIQDFFDSKPREFYARGIRDLPRRWQEVIDSNGTYVGQQ